MITEIETDFRDSFNVTLLRFFMEGFFYKPNNKKKLLMTVIFNDIN